MQKFDSIKNTSLSIALVAGLSVSGCNQPAANQNTTVTQTANTANGNLSVSTTTAANGSVSTTTTTADGTTIETRAPEQYQATVTIRVEQIGDGQQQQQGQVSPIALTAQVARNGQDQRTEFNLPNGEKVIYLDRADKRLLLLPTRNQYAELNRESVGVDIRQLLRPEQIVAQVQKLQGTELVGEEQLNGRTAIKYRHNSTTNTRSQAGAVATEAFVFVDKETGLPLRTESITQSQSGGSVQGIKGARIVTELSNIQTTVDANQFAEPTNLQKVAPEQVRSQINLLLTTATALLGPLLNNAGNAPAGGNNAPANSNNAPANSNSSPATATSPTGSPAQ